MKSADRHGIGHATEPVRMRRVALVAPRDELRSALLALAEAGTVQLDRISDEKPVADDEQVAKYVQAAVPHGEVAALTGWVPQAELADVASRLGEIGGTACPLPSPRGVDPPTLLPAGGQVRTSFSALVRTYGTVPYADFDPTIPAGFAYVLMFGMMFGDAGHGLLLAGAALLLRAGRPGRFAQLRAAWPFVGAASVAAVVFGALYGEFFGPTGVLPVLWLAPLADPVRLLTAAVAVGAVLLAVAYAVAIVNRWREGGLQRAVYAASGVAGLAVFFGLGGVAAGVFLGAGALTATGGVVAGLGLVLAAIGFYSEAGGGAGAVAQAGVEVFDTVIRLGSNLFSFARLAAFGLTHAALGWLVWTATVNLWHAGGVDAVVGVVVFVVGNALAFALEALIAAIQALRLEFYELFSRVFSGEGEPFRPWRLPAEHTDKEVMS